MAYAESEAKSSRHFWTLSGLRGIRPLDLAVLVTPRIAFSICKLTIILEVALFDLPTFRFLANHPSITWRSINN